MKKFYIAVALLALAGCANQTATEKVALADACGTYANYLNNLAPQKHALDAKTVAAVDSANALVDPVCSPGAIPADYDAAIGLVTQEAAAIYAIYKQHKS